MKILGILVVGLLAGCKQEEPQKNVIERPDVAETMGYHLVKIVDCHGVMSNIFADKEMTVPLPNPVVSDSHGGYKVWVAAGNCLSFPISEALNENK